MFSNLFSKSEVVTIPWNQLTSVSDLEKVDEISTTKPVVLFKHSTRCSISAMSLGKFERSYQEDSAFEPFFLDLIANRDLSNMIAEKYGVRHESPQAILVKDGKAIFDSSHTGINYAELNELAEKS